MKTKFGSNMQLVKHINIEVNGMKQDNIITMHTNETKMSLLYCQALVKSCLFKENMKNHWSFMNER